MILQHMRACDTNLPARLVWFDFIISFTVSYMISPATPACETRYRKVWLPPAALVLKIRRRLSSLHNSLFHARIDTTPRAFSFSFLLYRWLFGRFFVAI